MRGLILAAILAAHHGPPCTQHWCTMSRTLAPEAALLWQDRRPIPQRTAAAIRVMVDGQPLHPTSGSSCAAHYEWRTVIVATVIACGRRLEVIGKNVSARPVRLIVAYRYVAVRPLGGPAL